MESIKIATGLKTYEIEDENGNVRGTISFNPSDMNFFTRARQTRNKIEDILERVQNAPSDITEDGIVDFIEQSDKEIKAEINKLFDDPKASKTVFGNQNCFNSLAGVTFVERFLEAFTPIIQNAFIEEQKKSKDRVDKYISQVK